MLTFCHHYWFGFERVSGRLEYEHFTPLPRAGNRATGATLSARKHSTYATSQKGEKYAAATKRGKTCTRCQMPYFWPDWLMNEKHVCFDWLEYFTRVRYCTKYGVRRIKIKVNCWEPSTLHQSLPFSFFQIPLYAEYDRPKLLTFLRNSNYYPLQKVTVDAHFVDFSKQRNRTNCVNFCNILCVHPWKF